MNAKLLYLDRYHAAEKDESRHPYSGQCELGALRCYLPITAIYRYGVCLPGFRFSSWRRPPPLFRINRNRWAGDGPRAVSIRALKYPVGGRGGNASRQAQDFRLESSPHCLPTGLIQYPGIPRGTATSTTGLLDYKMERHVVSRVCITSAIHAFCSLLCTNPGVHDPPWRSSARISWASKAKLCLGQSPSVLRAAFSCLGMIRE